MRYAPAVFTAFLAMIAAMPSCWAQGAKGKAAEEDEKAIPDPVEERLEFKDPRGKLLSRLTYYPSKLGKEAVPVLLLHGAGGSRADYDFLARVLQSQGHAAIVPDLRGHGDTKTIIGPNEKRIDVLADKFKALDYVAMIGDLDVVKSWMVQKNNAEEFNLEQLTVVGADMSTVTAMNWALRDWKAPLLLNYKNCQDVKAVILLSPEHNYKGNSIKEALSHPYVGSKMSVFIAVGKQTSSAFDEAKRLLATLERQHVETQGDKEPKDKEVVFFPVETKLQGTKLVDPEHKSFKVIPVILSFIDFRVKSKAEDFPWTARIKP